MINKMGCIKTGLSLFIFVGFIGGLASQEVVQSPSLLELVNKTRMARMSGDNRSWLEYGQQLLALAPDHPDLLISIARALSANGRVADSAHYLRDAVDRGAGFDLYSFPEFANLRNDEVLGLLAHQALQNMTAVPHAVDFTVIDDTGMRPEGITYDSKTDRFFVGGVRGEIWQIDKKGKVSPFISGEGLREVYGLKVDVERRMLWAVTGVFPDLFVAGEPKKDAGIAGVQAYNVDTGKKITECWLDERPMIHGFNDLALAQNGDVYVTDSAKGSVYRLTGGQKKFELLAHANRFSFPNGLVLSADQRRLYVAHIEGISVVDTRTGQLTRLTVPATAAVNSIDGLAWDQGDLLGIQSSPYLARVIRIHLSPDGLSVKEVSIVSSRTPGGYNQTTGVVTGKDFFVVASVPAGAPQNSPQTGTAAPSRILRISLNRPAV
jgi:sugar lactone lactonase YvrE